MHPVIRIISFVVFAFALAIGTEVQLALGAVLLAALWLVTGGRGLSAGLRMLSRLRWLLLSILVVYLWFTPGTPLLTAWPEAGWMPTREGLVAGAQRVGILAVMVMTVSVLIASTPRERLLGALYWLALPLSPFGLSRERLVLRTALAFEAVVVLQRDLVDRYAELRLGQTRLGALAGTAAQAFADVVRRAETEPCAPRRLTVPDAPSRMQWLYPLLLGLAFWGAGQV